MSQEDQKPKSKNPLFGKRWMRNSTHTSYETAVAEKEKLTSESSDISVKIKRMADEKFVVKVRTTVEAANSKKKDATPPKTRAQRKKAKAEKHKARQEKD
jgi:hypothetical protein